MAKKKNRVKKKGVSLNFTPVKTALNAVGKENVIFVIISAVMFFGLILGAQVKAASDRSKAGLILSVMYKGNSQVGKKLSVKGKEHLLEKGYTSINDEGLLENLYSFYDRLPEVRKVYYVKKIYPERLELKIETRTPYVRAGRVFFDRSGSRLGEDFNRVAVKMKLPYITGLTPPPSLSPGEVWENMYFQETLKALAAVESKISVRRVILKKSRGRYPDGIVLETMEGAMVYWGKVFQEGIDSGIGVTRKIRNLDNALKVIASNLHRVEYADISREKPVIDFK